MSQHLPILGSRYLRSVKPLGSHTLLKTNQNSSKSIKLLCMNFFNDTITSRRISDVINTFNTTVFTQKNVNVNFIFDDP